MIYGVHTGLQSTTTAELIDLWKRVEDMGFDWISIWDHFYSADASGEPTCLEAVACHTALAMATTRVRCGSLVYSIGYRHPAVLANAICTIDQLSNGRAEIGLGAGWFVLEYQVYGIPFGQPRERLDALEEAVQCVRGLLHDETTTFQGKHFSFSDARCEPKPVQQHLPIWIGGTGEKRTARIAARYADGWNVAYISPQDVSRKRDVLARHCAAIGRDPAEITLAVNVGLAWTEDDLQAQYGRLAQFVRGGVLVGSEDEVLERIREYERSGADQVNIVMRSPWNLPALERLAKHLF